MQSQTLEKNVIPKLIIFEKFNSDFYYNVQTRKSNLTSFEKMLPKLIMLEKFYLIFLLKFKKNAKLIQFLGQFSKKLS